MSNLGASEIIAETAEEPRFFLIEWFERYLKRYRNRGGALPAALELKYRHSLRVAQNAYQIAQGLRFEPAEVLLAEGCGLVHDIGRFPQYVRYGSFHDADTVDHGQEGLRTLEDEGMPSNLDPDDWERMACAVAYHNKKVTDIPERLHGESGFLLRLIRDADKLDIMDLVMQSVVRDGFRDLPDMLPHIGTGRELTPGVIEEILKTRTVSIGRLRTVADFLAMLASWFYDLNCLPAREMAVDRRMLQRIEQELPDTKDIRELLNDIKKRLQPGGCEGT